MVSYDYKNTMEKCFSVHMSSIHPARQADGVAGFFLAP